MTNNTLVVGAHAQLPTAYGDFQIMAYETNQDQPTLLIYKGDLKSAQSPIIRVHSECFTGDVLGSLRCDCGLQLRNALKLINSAGCGAVIYLRQEGRGIGLVNKLKAYSLQEQGWDTVEANLKLHLPVDSRSYEIAASILRNQGVSNINLLTNNPDKIQQLNHLGIHVDQRIPLEVAANQHDRQYLETKKHKLNHLLSEVD
ncbi:GTP cyclohydrolase II [Lentilactobacillus kosonis]|uniref:GTP cyclohydrolase-2 n=1 Tax=Lentilactobacillus kosonis TaxID=2810561 RepID=A0A401FIY4_9LACO|nr:GTP cyclohydrolase II [Lentilactobacillus kosonis]GAY72297.1 3,4-dihydroxy-2-butanone 4-phosphate synthase [Lentilactobacillus kosonis]